MTGFKKYALIAIVILLIANLSRFVVNEKIINQEKSVEDSAHSTEPVVPSWLEKSYELSQANSEKNAINVRDIFKEYVKTSTEIIETKVVETKVEPPRSESIDVKNAEMSLSDQTEITGLEIIAINLADQSASALLKVNGVSKVVFVGDTIGDAFLVTRISQHAIYVNSITE